MRRQLLRALFVVALILVSSSARAQETVEYYGLDAMGSIRVVFSPAGTVLSRVDYSPFGEQISASTSIPKAYAQLFRDGEAGVDYAEARMYQFRTGRFTAPDPVDGGLTNPQSWNRYSYVLNRPATLVDSTGLEPEQAQGQEMTCSFDKELNTDVCRTSGPTVNVTPSLPTDWSWTWSWLFGPINGEVFQPDWTGVPTVHEVIEAVGAAHTTYTEVVSEALGLNEIGECLTTASSCVAATMAVVPVSKVAKVARIIGHHSWPMYLGGAKNQLLARVPEPLHKLYHKGLDGFLPRWVGKTHYDNLGPEAQAQMLQTLGAYTKRFDSHYGTSFYETMKNNGFPY